MGDVSKLPKVQRPRAPSGLGKSGRALWRSIVADYSVRPDELRVLEDACRQADLVDALDAELRGQPSMVHGSRGQPVTSPLLREVRLHRIALAALLRQLHVEDLTGSDKRRRHSSAREAARTRWRR